MPEDLVGAKDVIRRLRRLNIGLGRFTADVLNWTIVPAADIHKPGFEGLLFRKQDVADYLKRLGEEATREEWRPDYVSKYKLWAKALMALKEMNLRVNSSGTARQVNKIEVIGLSPDDLARIASNVFNQALGAYYT